jgi:serine/threonine protein kinase
VRQACGDDTDLFAEVYELLACHADEEDPLESPLPWSEEPPIPATIGPFRVLGLIGRGGMGIVYRAQSLIRDDENASAVTQEAPVVALKVLRAGLVTSQLERRFEREIAVLRRFDHSSIAKLLDAGNVDGEPYLVTELVEGLTLSRWRSEVEPAPWLTAAGCLSNCARQSTTRTGRA